MDHVAESAKAKKIILIETISSIINDLCTNDIKKCNWGWCEYNGVCAKCYFANHDNFPKKLLKIKSLLKCVKAKFNKKIGRINPTNLGGSVHEIASTLVGCDIYEHELVKNCKWMPKAIYKARTLTQIAELLNRKHIHVNGGRGKLWHYGKT